MKRQFIMLMSIVVSLVSCEAPLPIPTQTAVRNLAEEADIKSIVENFGKKLQMVSLLSPTASQQVQDQYSEFVSPALLQTWMSDKSKAPGRVVSSPWPDRIEITTLTKIASDKYVVTGSVIEITSMEIGTGNAAGKVPVQIVLQNIQGRWLIIEYAEKR